jgi:hypothetical protein
MRSFSMFRLLISRCAILLALSAASAHAAGGLTLSWGDCGLNGAGESVQTFACDTELGSQQLYCALQAPQPIDSVLGLRIVIDLQVASATLPDWWHYDPGGCREGALNADASFGELNTCQNMWLTTPSGGLLSYTVGMPRGGANQARIELAFAVPSNQPLSLDATDVYYAARILLADTGATGGCAGCQTPACLGLESITVLRPPRPEGTPSADVVISTPLLGNSNWAGWQTAAAASCQAVPVVNRTWGQVKSLYR